jgi:hypothetical protein
VEQAVPPASHLFEWLAIVRAPVSRSDAFPAHRKHLANSWTGLVCFAVRKRRTNATTASSPNTSPSREKPTLQVLRWPEHADHYPSVVRKDRSHKKAGVSGRMAHLVEELFSHVSDGCLFIAKPLNLFPVQDTQFPILDHCGVNPVPAVAATENVAEFVGQFL